MTSSRLLQRQATEGLWACRRFRWYDGIFLSKRGVLWWFLDDIFMEMLMCFSCRRRKYNSKGLCSKIAMQTENDQKNQVILQFTFVYIAPIQVKKLSHDTKHLCWTLNGRETEHSHMNKNNGKGKLPLRGRNLWQTLAQSGWSSALTGLFGL